MSNTDFSVEAPGLRSLDDLNRTLMDKRQEAPEPGTVTVDQLNAQIKERGGIVNTLTRGAKAVGEAVVGKSEFNYPEIISGSSHLRDLDLMSALMRARGENEMIEVLKQRDPELPQSKDKHGNTIVKFEGRPYYLNKSGFSQRDLEEVGRDTLMTLVASTGIGRVAAGAPMLVRAAGQGIAGVLGSLGIDILSATATKKMTVDIPAAVASAVGGLGGELAGTAIGSVINMVKTNPAKFVTSQGKLTPAGENAFIEVGIDPADVSDRLAREYARRAGETGPGAATAREVAASEFDVPLLRGQATGDFGQIAFEQAAKANARGETAGNIVRGRFERQDVAVEGAKKSLAGEFGQVATQDERASAGLALAGVRQQEATMGREVADAYREVERLGKGASISKDALENLHPTVQERLREAGHRIYDGSNITPASAQAMNMLEEISTPSVPDLTRKSGDALSPVGVALDAFEKIIRRPIAGKGGLRESAATPTDRMVMGEIVKGIDTWLDDVVDLGLISGNWNAVQALKDARSRASHKFKLFGERENAPAAANKALERMIEADVTEQEVANYIFGRNKIGDSPIAFNVAKRIQEIVGPGSDEWQAVRRGMWQRLVDVPPGVDAMGAQTVSQNIFQFVNGKGKATAELMFNADELAKMRRFAAVLKSTVPPRAATNPSGSAYEVARTLADFGVAGAPIFLRIFERTTSGRHAIRAGVQRAPVPRLRAQPPAIVPAAAAVAGANYEDED
jgi:hypothetical protein